MTVWFKFGVSVFLWALLSTLSGCGGGGGGGGENAQGHSTGTLVGQVVKGLTSTANVTLYSLTDSGQKTVVATALTNAKGEFDIVSVLQPGRVYLLEASGGSYINEISGVIEPLASPIRAVFVASGLERNFAINAISEAVVIELESSKSKDKWSASAVTAATTLINSAFDLSSPFDIRFVDLTSIPNDQIANMSKGEIAFSFNIGIFAGLLYELRLRAPGITLTQAMQKFHSVMRGVDQDGTTSSALMAGVIRFVEKLPSSVFDKSRYFSAIGLPSDANSSQFNGAESSGYAVEYVPNWKLRFLGLPNEGEQPTYDTVFDTRGALVAYRMGDVASGAGFSHVGYASVADVYGTAETAIGRWNRGYYYQHSVGFDASRNRFLTGNARLSGFDRDMVYAAAIPATNMPACGTVVMAPQAQTKNFSTYDKSHQLTIDDSSRIVVQTINGTTLYRYNIVLRDDLRNLYGFSTVGGVTSSFQGEVLPSDRIFRSPHLLTLPSGESLGLKGMIAGNGGTKAIVTIGTNIHTTAVDGLAAAFAQVSSSQDCKSVVFSSGAVNPIPDNSDYQIRFMQPFGDVLMGAKLFSNGTPNFDAFGGLGVTADSGVEKSGNNLVGIGILKPPFFLSGNTANVPLSYIYFKSSDNAVYPQSGSVSYKLIASTPFLVKSANQLISADSDIQSAALTIYFDQNPLGVSNQWYGTCVLTINGQIVSSSNWNLYYRDGGMCRGASPSVSYEGGVSSNNGQYAAIKYVNDYSTVVKGEASLLFERLP